MRAGKKENRPMPRLTIPILAVLVVALLLFAFIAERALLDSARLAEEKGAEEKARLTAVEVSEALDAIESNVLAEKTTPGVTSRRLAFIPEKSLPAKALLPYEQRPRDELTRLLSSSETTPSGLPEAVVALIALGHRIRIRGTMDVRTEVVERFLSGVLPVRPEDVPALSRRMGVADDPRAAALQDLLRRAPDQAKLPSAPRFLRRLKESRTIVGWSRTESQYARYEIALHTVLERARVAKRAALVGDPRPGLGALHRVQVPDVEGLTLVVAPETEARLRVRVLRGALWLVTILIAVGAIVVTRAVKQEARAIARERAFLANVTHELRTPLTAIRILGETLAAGRGAAQEYGSLVAQEADRLGALVENVLAATKADEHLSFDTVQPAQIVRSALDVVSVRARQRSVRLTWTGHDGLPQVMWDDGAVRRAVLNLLDNAVRHGASPGNVEIRTAHIGAFVHIIVKDDGPGIRRRDRRGLFGRFEARARGGTGLGLYLVEQVAKGHGGRVELASEEGQGATFALILPVTPDEARAAPPKDAQTT
jgi:signal transduction histidine kinase